MTRREVRHTNLDSIVSIQEIISLKIKDGAYVINRDEYK